MAAANKSHAVMPPDDPYIEKKVRIRRSHLIKAAYYIDIIKKAEPDFRLIYKGADNFNAFVNMSLAHFFGIEEKNFKPRKGKR